MATARLLTIVGPGGVGKTSIARALANAVAATWIELAPAGSPAQAFLRIADALGYTFAIQIFQQWDRVLAAHSGQILESRHIHPARFCLLRRNLTTQNLKRAAVKH